jgi:hypothetical protein
VTIESINYRSREGLQAKRAKRALCAPASSGVAALHWIPQTKEVLVDEERALSVAFIQLKFSLPLGEVTLPRAEVTLPRAEVTLPRAEVTLPRAEVTLPRAEVNLPLGGVSLPRAGIDPVRGETKLTGSQIDIYRGRSTFQLRCLERGEIAQSGRGQTNRDPLAYRS